MFALVSTRAQCLLATFSLWGLAACTPANDWRDIAWTSGQVAAEFPCKPDQVEVGAARMARCESGGLHFGLAWQVLASPDQSMATLQGVMTKFSRETSAEPRRMQGGLPAGALAWPEAGRYAWSTPAQSVRVMVWSRGLTVYQATVVSSSHQADATAATAARFFNGIRSLP
jgi:hypothetical protein